MKIVSYNINLSNPKKVQQLFTLNADIYIVPEIAKEEELCLPTGYQMEWNGIIYDKPFYNTKSKGLGIIWKKGNGSIISEYDKSLKYSIPLLYDDKLILSFWPTHVEKNGSYTKIAKSIIEKYSPLLKGNKSIISGDFNLFFKPPKKTPSSDILQVDSLLKSIGLNSVYHDKNNLMLGNETDFTFYQKRENKYIRFFLDYTYTNCSYKTYELIDLGRKFSDHVGQIIVL